MLHGTDGQVVAADHTVASRPDLVGRCALPVIDNESAGLSFQLGDALIDLSIDENGLIRVATLEVGDDVFVTIQDDGCGMTPDVLERIFDPFFTSKAVGEGTGLGLAICHQIVSRHGGDIRPGQ